MSWIHPKVLPTVPFQYQYARIDSLVRYRYEFLAGERCIRAEWRNPTDGPRLETVTAAEPRGTMWLRSMNLLDTMLELEQETP